MFKISHFCGNPNVFLMSEMRISKFEDNLDCFQSFRGNPNVFLMSAIRISSFKEFWLGNFARNPNVFNWNVHNVKVAVSFSQEETVTFTLCTFQLKTLRFRAKLLSRNSMRVDCTCLKFPKKTTRAHRIYRPR